MKVLAALALCLCLTGCPSSTTTTPPLAPGYLNASDQQMGEILAGARSFYTSIQSQGAAGTLTLNTTAKLSFNDFGAALNAAETDYLAYHSGAATQAQAQAAVNDVQTKQAALPLPGVAK